VPTYCKHFSKQSHLGSTNQSTTGGDSKNSGHSDGESNMFKVSRNLEKSQDYNFLKLNQEKICSINLCFKTTC